MDIRKLLGMLLLGSGLALTGCGDDGGNGGDDGGEPPVDSGGEDSGGGGLDLPVATVGGTVSDPMAGSNADFSCMGSITAPSEDGTAVDFDFVLEDFQSGEPQADVCVNFYADNTLPQTDTCGGTMTDASGIISVSDVPGSWYAYRVFAKEGATAATTVVPSTQVNEVAAEAGGSVTGNSVSAQTINLIPTVLGFQRADGTAIVSGQAFDCGDEAVYGVVTRIYIDGTLIEEGDGNFDPHYEYFDGEEFPSSGEPHTNVDGLYASANIPVPEAGAEFTLEIWGRAEGDTEARVLGCETSRLNADGVAIVNVGPMRSDGPSCPGAM